MSIIASILLLAGGVVAVLAGVGLLKFSTAYARFHAAGKASPVAFVLAALGAAFEVGPAGAAVLLLASVALVLTLPIAVHLLFRAVHRTTDGDHLVIDELSPHDRR
jgi:multicomponent Na+:H+ antiporter subunit G